MRLALIAGVALVTCAVVYAQGDARADLAMMWTIPAQAPRMRNPLTSTPEVLASGKALYVQHCQRCHGPQGKNDGPSADHDEATADLTDGSRVGINPDGVVFYKIWNGRFRPNMPAFGSGVSNGRQGGPGTLSENDVWKIVAYAQTLRSR